MVTLYKELAICKGFSADMLGLASAVEVSFDRRELYRRGDLLALLMSTWLSHNIHTSHIHTFQSNATLPPASPSSSNYYYAVLGHVKDRLLSTIYWCEEVHTYIHTYIHTHTHTHTFIRRPLSSSRSSTENNIHMYV